MNCKGTDHYFDTHHRRCECSAYGVEDMNNPNISRVTFHVQACDHPRWYPTAYYAAALAMLLFAAFMICGCDQRATLRIKLVDERVPESESRPQDLYDEVLDACDLLGVDCEPWDRSYGAVTLLIFDVGAKKGTKGRGFINEGCHRAAWAHVDGKEHRVPSSRVIAHELFHTMTDGDHEEAPNLMDEGSSAETMTKKQRKRFTRNARLFYHGCFNVE